MLINYLKFCASVLEPCEASIDGFTGLRNFILVDLVFMKSLISAFALVYSFQWLYPVLSVVTVSLGYHAFDAQ